MGEKEEFIQGRFKEEIAIVMGSGIDYDFSRDGQLDLDEVAVMAKPRRARRV